MEMEYGDEATRRLHLENISYGTGFDKRAIMRLNRIRAAVDQRDLSALEGNRFEKLKGDRAGSCSIRINDQWRITFRIKNNLIDEVAELALGEADRAEAAEVTAMMEDLRAPG